MIPVDEREEIAYRYGWNVKQLEFRPVGHGHIHASYSVTVCPDASREYIENDPKSEPSFFLQRINTNIFSDPEKLMDNIDRVSRKINSLHDDSFVSLEIINATDGSKFITVNSGKSYRVYRYLSGFEEINQGDSGENLRNVGKSFGKFIAVLQTENIQEFYVPLNDFHHVGKRLFNLQKTSKVANTSRLQKSERLLRIIETLHSESLIIQHEIDDENIPIRLCHNDTKSSNIMFNSTAQSNCVVDLDTVMPSSLLFDYGDAIRSIITEYREDHPVSEVELQWAKVQAFTEGFVSSTKSFILPAERENLARSCVLLPYIMGVRFLTDYLDNDQYFKITRDEQNLDRAANQLNLALQIQQNKQQLTELIDNCFIY